MLKARRKKQSTKKRLAGIAKRAKKLGRQTVKTVSADAPNICERTLISEARLIRCLAPYADLENRDQCWFEFLSIKDR
jgi:hypothetical protein